MKPENEEFAVNVAAWCFIAIFVIIIILQFT